MIHKSAFNWPGCTQPSMVGTMSRGELPLRGNKHRTFTKGLKRIGTNQRVTHQTTGGYTHTCHACWWQVWHFNREAGESSLSRSSHPSILLGYVHEQGGNLRLARAELLGLTKGLKLGSYHSRPGGIAVELW